MHLAVVGALHVVVVAVATVVVGPSCQGDGAESSPVGLEQD